MTLRDVWALLITGKKRQLSDEEWARRYQEALGRLQEAIALLAVALLNHSEAMQQFILAFPDQQKEEISANQGSN